MRAAILAAAFLVAGCASSTQEVASTPKPTKAATPREGKSVILSEMGWLEEDQSPVTRMRLGGRQPVTVRPIEFRIDTLPLGTMPAPPTARAPAEIPATTSMPVDVVLEPMPAIHYGYGVASPYKPHALRPTGFAFADAKMGTWPAAPSQVQVMCGSSPTAYGVQTYYGAPVQAVHWEGLRKVDGRMEYAIVDGWFDSKTCRVQVTRRESVELGVIVPDLVFGFRSCPPPDKGAQHKSCHDNPQVTLFFPKSTGVASTRRDLAPPPPPLSFTRANIQVRRGTGESLAAEISEADLRTWVTAVSERNVNQAKNRTANSFVLEVEIQMASNDERPTAIAFIGEIGGRSLTALFAD